MYTSMIPPEATPKGDTSNQTRIDDGQGDVRSGVLRLFVFVACVLLMIGAFAMSPYQSHPRMQEVCVGFGSIAVVACLVQAVGFVSRAIRRRRASRKLVLFHKRAAGG